LEESDHNNRNKWNHFLAVVFSFIVNFIFLLIAKLGWDRLTVQQKRRLIAGLVVWSWVLFGLMVFVSIFFPDEISALHESKLREPLSAVIGIAFAVIVLILVHDKCK
jgi:hypothetical protein